jgi:putative flippase GtrA
MIRRDRSLLLRQAFRFALSGSLVALVYLATTTLLHEVLAVPFQIALAIGFTLGLCLHFTLQRLFVWRHRERFALQMHRQVGRYLLVTGAQYGITALSTSQLPALVGMSVEVVYLTTIFVITLFNFIIFRGHVFHAGSAAVDPAGVAIVGEHSGDVSSSATDDRNISARALAEAEEAC